MTRFERLADAPRREVRALLASHVVDMESRADSFPSAVVKKGGPTLDGTAQSLVPLWEWALQLPLPTAPVPLDALRTQPLPWWVPSYGGWMVARRVGAEVCDWMHGFIAYIARCHRTLAPRSEWVLSNARRSNADYNRILFRLPEGPELDLIFMTMRNYTGARYPRRDPLIDDGLPPDVEQTIGPPPISRTFRDDFDRARSFVAASVPPTPVEDHAFDGAAFDGAAFEDAAFEIVDSGTTNTVRVVLDDALARSRTAVATLVSALRQRPEVRDVREEDREVLLVTFQDLAAARAAGASLRAAATTAGLLH